MSGKLIAKAEKTIDAPIDEVWYALVDPSVIKQYMFGADVESDWQIGSDIFWRGEWKGKPYEDKGKILKMEEKRLLQYSHWSPMSGKEDSPENYHTVTVELKSKGDKTQIRLSQDGNADEETRKHSEENWNMMLDSMKKLVEKK